MAAIDDKKQIGAFKMWLMDRDISQFDPMAHPPRTAAQEAAENDSMTPASQIVMAGLDDPNSVFRHDLISLKDVEDYICDRDRQGAVRLTPAKVRKAMSDAGIEKLTTKVRVDQKLYNLWAVRNHASWHNATHSELSEAYALILKQPKWAAPTPANSNTVTMFRRSST